MKTATPPVRVFVSLLLIAGAVLFMAPMYQMLVMALKTPDEIQATSPFAWPAHPTWQNFVEVTTDPEVSFLRFFENTLVITVLSTAGTVISASLAAFAFSRLKFRARDRIFVVLLSTMMLPGMITIIPSYILFARLGWVNTNLPLWVPAWLGGGAFNIFLLRQFFLGIPRELDEAARIDGATNACIFWRVVAPLSKPALATVAIFSFVGSWTDFMGPLLYLNDREKQTLELGLRTFQTIQKTQWNLLMAASLVVMLPIVIIFLAGQRYFVRGISLTGGK
ncbi:MAG TPA: carbohydrate ABC transporter permease [Fimbriimonas sp.]|nr:carbohydrate ABC transporter permease [Fimbriimonas sp.]